MFDAGEAISLSQLAQLERYQSLFVQVEWEISQYSSWLARNVADTQDSYLQYGIDTSTKAINAIYELNGVTADFQTLPVDAVQNMVGLTGDGSPLVKFLQDRLPATTVTSITSTLIANTALGINPRQTAREMM